MWGRGRTVVTLLSTGILVKQAKPFSPLMFIAQEPQIPSRQDLLDKTINIIVIKQFLPSERESGILLVLNLEKSIENHGTATTHSIVNSKMYSFKSIAYFS